MTTATSALGTRFARGGALLRAREVGIGVVLLLVFGVTTLHNHNFATANSVQQLLSGAALIAMLGVGETLVIVTRNVDLSVGSIVGLSAFVVGDLFKDHPGTPVILGFVVGIAIGAVNGVIIAPSNIPNAFIAIGFRTIAGIPWLAIIAFAVVVIVAYAMRSFRSGRDLYAIGSNPEAAALAGVPVARRVFTAFVISGSLAG